MVPQATSSTEQLVDRDAEWLNDVVSQFESGYHAAIEENSNAVGHDPTLNIYAWSGLQRTEQEVFHWIEGIASRLLAPQPRRLLEIGCGTGLLLFRLAPHVAEYWATDLSPAALNDIQRRLAPTGLPASKVKLLRLMAHDFSGLPTGHFDAAILNGVIEYFPNVNYLLRVLKGMLRLLAPNGFIFLGALPNLAAQEILQVSGDLNRAGDAEDVAVLRQRVRNRMAGDRRLLVSPEFFRALPKIFPEITGVKIQPLRGCFENEASQLLAEASFDVILKTAPVPAEKRAVRRLDWVDDKLDPTRVMERMRASQDQAWCITRVPHGRMRQHHQMLASWPQSGTTVGELRQRLAADRLEAGLAELLQSGADAGFIAEVTWSNTGADGLCDVVFYRQGEKEPEVETGLALGSDALQVHANDPQRALIHRDLVRELRVFLQGKLPGHLVPSRFVLLDKLPLMPNGKLDRRALPSVDMAVALSSDDSTPPRTPAEKALAQIWSEVLRVKQVGAHDNFFDLGGHSLLVAQVMGRIRSGFQVELPMRQMFEQPTLAGFAAALEERLMESIQALSEAEAEELMENAPAKR